MPCPNARERVARNRALTETMTRISFTANLQRHVPSPPREVSASTVAQALELVFDANPRLRRYVLDDQGALRRNMVIFVDGWPVVDRKRLTDPLSPDAEIHVMQALTGG